MPPTDENQIIGQPDGGHDKIPAAKSDKGDISPKINIQENPPKPEIMADANSAPGEKDFKIEQPISEQDLKNAYIELPGIALDPNNPFSEILVRPLESESSEEKPDTPAPPFDKKDKAIFDATIVKEKPPETMTPVASESISTLKIVLPEKIENKIIAKEEIAEEKISDSLLAVSTVSAEPTLVSPVMIRDSAPETKRRADAEPMASSQSVITEIVSEPVTEIKPLILSTPENTPENDISEKVAAASQTETVPPEISEHTSASKIVQLGNIESFETPEQTPPEAVIPDSLLAVSEVEAKSSWVLPAEGTVTKATDFPAPPPSSLKAPASLSEAPAGIVPPDAAPAEDKSGDFSTKELFRNYETPPQPESSAAAPSAEIQAIATTEAPAPIRDKSEMLKIIRNLKFHRMMFMSTALTMGIFLLAITLFLGGGALEEKTSVFNDLVKAYGETKITLISGDNYFIRGNHPLFGGETIDVKNGTAEIDFKEGSIVRLRENTQITIMQMSPNVVIYLNEGEIWVMGNRAAEIRFKNATFYARSNSARFKKEADRITASSYRHPLFTELSPAGTDKKAFFAIPSKKRIKFSEDSISRSLPELHFSKLKKEILFSDAEKDEWAARNSIDDSRIVTMEADDLKLEKKNSPLGKSLFASMEDVLVVFPERKKRSTRNDQQNRQSAFISELLTDGTPMSMKPAELSDDAIDLVLSASNLVIPNKNLVNSVEELRTEIKNRNHFDPRERLVAQNILSMLEDAMEENDPVLAETIISSMTKEWQTANRNEENRVMLEMYREIIADLFRKHINLVTPSMLQASTRLDSIAISWGKKQMTIIATLEIIEKNLETADIFLEKSKLDMAKGLLDINDVLFKVRPTSDLIASFEAMQNRQEFLKEKYAIFKTQGWLNKDELFELLKKREDAQRILLYMEEEQKKIEEMNTVSVAETPLADRIREDFITNKLQIVSMIGAEDENAKSVEIVEAILPDGQRFSGEYLPDFQVIRNVELDDEKSIANEIKLSKLIETIDSLRTNKINSIGEDLRQLRTKPLPKLEEDPVSKMDPIVIEVTRRLNQAALAQKGFTVPLKNILLTSPKTLHILGVPFEESETHSLEFDIDNDTKTLSNAKLLPENIPVDADSLDSVSAKATEALDKYTAKLELEHQVEWALLAAGLTLDTKNIRSATTGIYFEQGKFHDWTLSGLADPENRTFIIITKGGKEFLKNTGFDSLKDILKNKWDEEEKIKTFDTQNIP